MPWMTLQAGDVLVETAYSNRYRYQILGPGRVANNYRYDVWTAGAWAAVSTVEGRFSTPVYRLATVAERPSVNSPLLHPVSILRFAPTVPQQGVVFSLPPLNRQVSAALGSTPSKASVSNGAALLQFFGADAARKPAGMPNTCGRCEGAMSATLDVYHGITQFVTVSSTIEGALTLNPGQLCTRCRPRGC